VAYTVEIAPAAKRQIRALPKAAQARVVERLRALAEEPRPRGAKKLQGEAGDFYRVRVGDYRVVYSVDGKKLEVLVVKVAHRREVYR